MKKIILLIITLLCIIVLGSDFLVSCNAKGKLYETVDDVPELEVGLLLGTAPKTRISGRKNAFFKYRIEAAKQLYDAGKIRRILISGDEHSLEGVNEPEAMRDSLVVRGVPEDIILLDGRGYRTINSVINAHEVFGFDSIIVISQKFHVERAMYQADHLGVGIDDVWGYCATSPRSTLSILTYLREYLARVKMFIDLVHKDEYLQGVHSEDSMATEIAPAN